MPNSRRTKKVSTDPVVDYQIVLQIHYWLNKIILLARCKTTIYKTLILVVSYRTRILHIDIPLPYILGMKQSNDTHNTRQVNKTRLVSREVNK